MFNESHFEWHIVFVCVVWTLVYSVICLDRFYLVTAISALSQDFQVGDHCTSICAYFEKIACVVVVGGSSLCREELCMQTTAGIQNLYTTTKMLLLWLDCHSVSPCNLLIKLNPCCCCSASTTTKQAVLTLHTQLVSYYMYIILPFQLVL